MIHSPTVCPSGFLSLMMVALLTSSSCILREILGGHEAPGKVQLNLQ